MSKIAKSNSNEGNKAAYPFQEIKRMKDTMYYQSIENWEYHLGMTKREEIAKAAMQGILTQTQEWAPEFVADKAVKCADALLRRLEES